MSYITNRASKSTPCPVCAKTKSCSVTDDGKHFCRGIADERIPEGWRELPGSPDDHGFRHFVQADSSPLRPKRWKMPPKPSRDWQADAERFAMAMTADLKTRLADSLGLPVEAIDAVPQIGHNGESYTLPECDSTGRIVGITRRFPDGSKRMLTGGHRGLALPVGWRESAGPVFIVEGASDVLAMTAAGLTAIGRPAAAAGADMLAELLRTETREIVVMGENDKKSDGRWPGRDGAESVARKLADAWGRPVAIAFPPDGAKDVRGWLTDELRASMPWPERGETLRAAIMASAGAIEPSGEAATEAGRKGPSMTDRLIAIGRTAELFHNAAGDAFATFDRKTVPVDSGRFREWLTANYYAETGKGPNGDALKTAINTLKAIAIHDAPEAETFVRLTIQNETVYLSLADDAGTVIRIDASGWRVDPSPPVKFLTTKNAKALPMPEPDGRIEELRQFVNCPGDDDFALLCGWISACFRPDSPMPILILTGGQGSAKSTTCRILKSLIDPEHVKDRASPKDELDLSIWASYSFLLAVDNVSKFPDWLSDCFCRLATGAGFGTRTKYTTADETIFEAQRPAILNGIEDFATRGDLVERSIILRHPPISDGQRQLDADLWATFEKSKPKLLGAILDRISAGLRTLQSVKIDNLPRMADAARFAIACERGMNEPSRFEEAYRQNQADALESALLDSAIIEPLMRLFERSGGFWEGTPTVLLESLNQANPSRNSIRWPKSASRLSGCLQRLAPALAKCRGVIVTDFRTTDRNRKRMIRIEGEKFREMSSDSSDASANRNNADASDGKDA